MSTRENPPTQPAAAGPVVRGGAPRPAWPAPLLIARGAAGSTVMIGVLVLVGWAAAVPQLRTLGPAHLAAMNPTAALGLATLGSALWLLARPDWRRSREIATAFAVLAMLVGLVRLVDLLLGGGLGVDAFLLGDAMRGTGDGRSNRMAPNTAVNLVLLGSALLFQARKSRVTSVVAQVLALIVLFTAQTALIGHAYQSGWFESIGVFNRMAIPTAVSCAALALGIMTTSSEDGLIAILFSDGPGGSLARILLPTGVVVPAALGWLLIQSRRGSLIAAGLADTFFVLVTMLVFVAMVAWIATQFHESHLDRVRTEQALRESEVQHRFIAENSSDVVSQLDFDGRIIYVSPSCERVLGFLPEEMLRMAPFAIVHAEDADRVRRHFNRLLRGEPVGSIECRVLHKTGRHLWMDMMWRSGANARGEVERFQVSSRDITDRKTYQVQLEEAKRRLSEQAIELEEKNDQLKSLATTDALTELKNRRAFEERLEEELARSRRHGYPLSLILLDIDHFKAYNDTYGHPRGDEVLRKVGRLLGRSMRDTDFAARYGGEEFAIILPHTDRAGAHMVAERLRRAIEGASWEDRAITASVGVASFSQDASTAEALVEYADRALYRSKENGRNRVTVAELQ